MGANYRTEVHLSLLKCPSSSNAHALLRWPRGAQVSFNKFCKWPFSLLCSGWNVLKLYFTTLASSMLLLFLLTSACVLSVHQRVGKSELSHCELVQLAMTMMSLWTSWQVVAPLIAAYHGMWLPPVEQCTYFVQEQHKPKTHLQKYCSITLLLVKISTGCL